MNKLTARAQSTEKTDRRRRAALWISGGAAAGLLVLAVNGTLSSWTSAVIDNPDNDVAVTGAVALVETGPGPVTCDTGTTTTNTATCSGINKYGGTTTPLDPDGTNSQSVTVNLKNTGTVSGDLVLSADTCGSAADTGATNVDAVTYPLCTKVDVTVSCTAPATLDTTASPEKLSAFTGGTVGTLAAGADTDCTFTVSVPAATPSAYSSQVASQALHWTLTAS